MSVFVAVPVGVAFMVLCRFGHVGFVQTAVVALGWCPVP